MKLLLALGVFTLVMFAQTFRSTTTLIRAEALVEENGHVVTGLQSDDFTILDEEQPRPIADFAAESGSIRLVLLLDASGSMQPAARQLVQAGLAAMSVLHPDDQGRAHDFRQEGHSARPPDGGSGRGDSGGLKDIG